jgi:hypothetical protein
VGLPPKSAGAVGERRVGGSDHPEPVLVSRPSFLQVPIFCRSSFPDTASSAWQEFAPTLVPARTI